MKEWLLEKIKFNINCDNKLFAKLNLAISGSDINFIAHVYENA